MESVGFKSMYLLISTLEEILGIEILFLDNYFQKKKPDWALGAKEGEAGIRSTSEGPPGEAELEV